ncbi:hypothetical protein [Leptospira idonii]|uniref:hypothetical protein n=1 Tax=Leptospira idonii TaxID=1193500 RepID=UPI0014382BA9|nr:hypothetical protein [Leptospira idonii]
MEQIVYRNIRSLHPKIRPLTLDEKIDELKNHPGFDLLIERIYSQVQIKGRFQGLID